MTTVKMPGQGTETAGLSNTQPETLGAFYRKYIKRTDINNGSTDYIFDENNVGQDLWAYYYSQGMVCPAPMDETINRRTSSHIYKFGDYSFLAYTAGNSHSVDSQAPHILEFARSDDNWETQELLRIKCINDSGTMREIEPLTDGFFPWNYQFVYAGSKLWAIISTYELTVNPPEYSTDYQSHKISLCHSEDFGDTWSELIDLDTESYIPVSKPIVVGNEIWITAYYGPWTVVNHLVILQPENAHSYILRYNVVTETAGTRTQIDTSWTGLPSTEACILEYATDKFMCVARVSYNVNYPGNETIHKGSVIAYSTDGLDWTDYTFYDEGTAYPNQPHLFQYNGYVYLSRGVSIMHGTVAVDESEIEWITRTTGLTPWYQNYIYNYRTFYMLDFERYDPRTGFQDQLRELNSLGSVDFVVLDETNEILGATIGYTLDGIYKIGEPWVTIIKRNSVGSGPAYTERLIYLAEIPGDYNDSDEIRLYNFFAAIGDTINVEWLNVAGKPIHSVSATCSVTSLIDFVSVDAVTNAKLIYEIDK